METRLQGYLDRKSGSQILKQYKRLYFVCEAHALIEYPTPSSKPAKIYPFSSVFEVKLDSKDSPGGFSFRLGASQYIPMRASDAKSAERWVLALKQGIAKQHGDGVQETAVEASRTRAMKEMLILRKNSEYSSEGEKDEGDEQVELPKKAISEGTSSKKSWGSSLRMLFKPDVVLPPVTFSPRNGAILEDDPLTNSSSSDKQVSQNDDNASLPAMTYEITTHRVVEYDWVEVFENQRWFPISHWGTKLLPHDRGQYTNRVGQTKTEWYKQSLEPMEANGTANTATSGGEDKEETPGPQVHIIKGSWQWVGPWVIVPLPTMKQDVRDRRDSDLTPPSTTTHAIVTVRERRGSDGLTNTRGSEALTMNNRHGSDNISMTAGGPAKEHRSLSLDSPTTSNQFVEPELVPPHHGGIPPHSSAPSSISTSTTNLSTNQPHEVTTPPLGSSKPPESPVASPTRDSADTALARASSLKNFRKRFGTSTGTQGTSVAVGSSKGSGGAFDSQNDDDDIDDDTLSHRPRELNHSSPQSFVRTLNYLPNRVGGAAAQLSNNTLQLAPHQPEAFHDDGWTYGFDFPEIDYAIARGVPRPHPPSATTNIRTRRLLRLRRRVTNITVKLSQIYLGLVVPLLSFERRVLAQGWLGSKARAAIWRSRYCKLVRVCQGIWDGGFGEGMVDAPPTDLLLVTGDCKETFRMRKTIHLTSTCFARLIVSDEPDLGEIERSRASLVCSPNRFEIATEDDPAARIGRDRDRFNHEYDGLPRSGRFELVIDKDHIITFTCDSKEDALQWISILNKAVRELPYSPTAADAAAAAALGGGNNALGTTQFSALETTGIINNEIIQNPSPANMRKKLFRFASSRKKSATLDDVAEETPDGPGSGPVFEDTGEEPFSNDANPFPTTLDFDGKMKEVVSCELPISVRTFFQVFVGEKAKFSVMDMHKELGDSDLKFNNWSEPMMDGGPRGSRDEYDFDGFDIVPERFMTFKTATGSAIGPTHTRVEKRNRYYYWPSHKTLIFKAWAKSLDVPYGDSFLFMERWVVQPVSMDNPDAKIRVQILVDVPFLKPSMLKGTIKNSAMSGSAKAFQAWKRKFLQVVHAAIPAETRLAAGEGGFAGELLEDDAAALVIVKKKRLLWFLKILFNALSNTVGFLVSIWRDIMTVSFAIFLVWWMMQLLQVLQSITLQLEDIRRGKAL